MVTVRLSEPPALSINTNGLPHPMPLAKSVLAHEYRLSHTMAETDQEEGDSSQAPPETPVVAEQGRTLQDELQGSDGPQDDGELPEPEPELATPASDRDGVEEVDWDQLQKTEDEQSDVQGADKVR